MGTNTSCRAVSVQPAGTGYRSLIASASTALTTPACYRHWPAEHTVVARPVLRYPFCRRRSIRSCAAPVASGPDALTERSAAHDPHFADRLHAELPVIRAEIKRLEARLRLLEWLLEPELRVTAGQPAAPTRRAAPRPARSHKSRRLPRGLYNRTVRESLAQQREPVHVTAIFASPERQGAAPQGASRSQHCSPACTACRRPKRSRVRAAIAGGCPELRPPPHLLRDRPV